MTVTLLKKGSFGHRDRHTQKKLYVKRQRKYHVTIGVMVPKTKGHPGLPGAGRGKKELFLRAFRGNMFLMLP